MRPSRGETYGSSIDRWHFNTLRGKVSVIYDKLYLVVSCMRPLVRKVTLSLTWLQILYREWVSNQILYKMKRRKHNLLRIQWQWGVCFCRERELYKKAEGWVSKVPMQSRNFLKKHLHRHDIFKAILGTFYAPHINHFSNSHWLIASRYQFRSYETIPLMHCSNLGKTSVGAVPPSKRY